MTTTETKTTRKELNRAKRLQKEVENHKAQKPIESLTITIEWKKSRTWGMNPHAEGRVVYKDGYCATGTAKASGCGYCKRSTVIADLFNQFLRYKLHSPEVMTQTPTPYGIVTPRAHDHQFSPYYMGGIGEGCFQRISEYIGGNWESISWTKTCEVYRYTEGAQK
ncbi:MAG: hypothetical protein EBT07_13365 [Actinobacteria bacterium]|nr:hypothetical protein [Actinomycetota bacterium]